MKHYLNPLFAPQSVAIIGASDRPQSVGRLVYENLLNGKFKGTLYAVNPKHSEVLGHPAYPKIQAIGKPIELAVIVTPPAAVASVIDSCGAAGVKAAVIITAGFGETGEAGVKLQRELMERAQVHGIRIIGPNCLGIMRPSIGLNATFSKGGAKAGKESGRAPAQVKQIAHARKSAAEKPARPAPAKKAAAKARPAAKRRAAA